MRRSLAPLAAAAFILAALAAPAAAERPRQPDFLQAAVGTSALTTGPGGCAGFNAALQKAIAREIRTGQAANARHLATLRQDCRGRL